MPFKKIWDFIGTITLAIGFFFAFLPHAWHSSLIKDESSHLFHIAVGFSLITFSLLILIINNKKI